MSNGMELSSPPPPDAMQQENKMALKPGEHFCIFKGGGDWYDASADLLVLNAGIEITKERERYRVLGSYDGTKKHFMEWVISEGLGRELVADDPMQDDDDSF